MWPPYKPANGPDTPIEWYEEMEEDWWDDGMLMLRAEGTGEGVRCHSPGPTC